MQTHIHTHSHMIKKSEVNKWLHMYITEFHDQYVEEP